MLSETNVPSHINAAVDAPRVILDESNKKTSFFTMMDSEDTISERNDSISPRGDTENQPTESND